MTPADKKKPSVRSLAENAFASAWEAVAPHGHDTEREYHFHPTRKWRFDFAWPSQLVAVEIDGRGRHQTVAGVRADCEKHNEAARLGWRVLRFPATDKSHAAEWAAMVIDTLVPPVGVAKE
jgi:very-short-patch-repair endonuclease